MTDSVHRSVHRSVERLATPVGHPVGQEVLRTDGRTDGLTKSLSHQPEITSSSVTRTRTYRFCPDDFGDTARTAAAMVYLAPPDPDAPLHLMQLHWALGDFCTIPGCPNPRRALCLCDTHYRAHVRATRNEAHLINRKATA